MLYKGYVGIVEFSENDDVLFGKSTRHSFSDTYEGTSVYEFLDDFHCAVDDYLTLCAEEGTKLEVAYKGSFNVRLKKPETYRRAAIHAMTQIKSLNGFIEACVRRKRYQHDKRMTLIPPSHNG